MIVLEKYERGAVKREVLIMDAIGDGSLTARQIASKTGLTRGSCAALASRMRQDGSLKSVGRCRESQSGCKSVIYSINKGPKMARETLPNRRECQIETIEVGEKRQRYFVSVGRFEDGRPAEIFIDSTRPTSESVILADDGAIIASIALQYGVPAERIIASVSRCSDGSPASVIGAALDLLASSSLECGE